jgi:histidinol-phosphate aminotransferase
MSGYLSKRANSITPYTAGFQPGGADIIKLNTNENPYPPSPKTLEACRAFDPTRLKLYPKADGGPLRAAVAIVNGVPESHVFCGNGSDEVLAFAFAAFFDGGIIFPDVTYSFYPVWADLFGISYDLLPLNDDFTIPIEGLHGSGVVLANPNAPTGIALSLEEVERVLKQNSGSVVIVDEAYVSFGGESAVTLIPKYDNLLVVTTLSKSHSLAGMRLGYALGQPHLIEGLERIKDSFNSYPVDSVAQSVGSAALLDKEYYYNAARKIIVTRERISGKLKELGFVVTPSSANFLFVSKPGAAGAAIKTYLEQNGIYVRHWNKPRISDYLRISVGTDEQMDTLVSKLEEFV